MKTNKKPAKLLVDIDVLAGALAMSRRQAYDLVAEGVLPPPERRGRYHLPASTAAYIEHLRSRGDPDLVALSRVRTERASLELDARRRELERGEAGPLVSLAEVREFFGRAVATYPTFRTCLKAFPWIIPHRAWEDPATTCRARAARRRVAAASRRWV